MREILFKAKRIDNGEWVEGFYQFSDWIYPTTGELAERKYYIRPIRSQDAFEVNPSTICQYTGLTDKNGNRIWENDIISYPQIHAKGNVAFVEDTFVLFDDWDGKQYINGMWNKFKVIGNIFDNADLAKE